MLNNQKPTPRVDSDGAALLVHSIFPTIQGEGPFAGKPAHFIRLAGCNLQCPLCDTEYTQGAKYLAVEEIARLVGGEIQLVVITGGEPFRQNIGPLVKLLRLSGFTVQIETNGKLPSQDKSVYRNATIVVSPKTETIHPEMDEAAHCFKYVISAGDVADDGLPIRALDHPVRAGSTIARPRDPILTYVQPADHHDPVINAKNMAAAVAAVQRKPRSRLLCLQMHKYAGLE